MSIVITAQISVRSGKILLQFNYTHRERRSRAFNITEHYEIVICGHVYILQEYRKENG